MEKIEIKYNINNLKYKIFGLFPYLELNDNNEYELFEAKTSVDGCYDKIAPSFKLPNGVNLIYNNEVILKEGDVYNYQTLMYNYRRFKSVLDIDDSFILFMEKGIGRIDLTREIEIKDEWDLVPNVINLVECESLYTELSDMKYKCEQYQELKTKNGVSNCDFECLCDRYERMGGDFMLNYYHEKIILSNEISSEYYTYAKINDNTYNINLFMCNTYKDLGTSDTYINLWDYDETYIKGDIVTYKEVTYICKNDGSHGDFINGDENGFIESDFEVFEEVLGNSNEDIVIEGFSNSELKSFRIYRDFILGCDVLTPSQDTDWLYYYKKGYLAHYETTVDSVGNINMLLDDEGNEYERSENVGSVEEHLDAYGDILYNIERDNDNQTITFTYIIGAHLVAELVKIELNELNKKIYKYGDYVYDENDKYHGIIYTEVHRYSSDSGINELTPDEFEDYITDYNYITSNVGEFSTLNSACYGEVTVNGFVIPVSYSVAKYKYTSKPSSQRILDKAPIIKPDYYETITYPTRLKNNVAFSRGNAAAFERHLKLGEVKTLDDMENYSNGGFFNVIKTE